MFSPPGTKIFASRLLHRKRNQMQQTAMKEAIAAGWQKYNSDEDDDDDDYVDNYNDADDYDDDDDERSAVLDLLRVDETDTTEVSNSLSTDGHILVYNNSKINKKSSQRTVPNPVSFDVGNDDDEDEDNDSSVESDEEDDTNNGMEQHRSSDGGTTALAHQDLHTLLETLYQQQTTDTQLPTTKTTSNRILPEHDTAYKTDYHSTADFNDESKAKVGITDNDERLPFGLSPKVEGSLEKKNTNEDDDDDDDTLSDTDSLDLGVSTSVWPSQKENHQTSFFNDTTSSNASAKRMIAEIGILSNVFSPKEKQLTTTSAMTAPSSFNNYFDTNNIEESAPVTYPDDDDIDEPHVGSEIFLFTEGKRYFGQGEAHGKNNLLHIQETASISFPADTKIVETEDVDNLFVDTTRNDLQVAINNEHNKQPKQSVDNCFGSIQLVSPKFFNTDNELSGAVPSVIEASNDTGAVMSPLSSMVHPMNLSLFDFNDVDRSIQKQKEKKMKSPTSNERKGIVDRVPSSILTSIEQDYALAEYDMDNNRRSNLSTSFKSSTTTNRIAYHIKSDGKRSMTKSDRSISKSFLPKEQIVNPNSTKSMSNSLRSSSSKNKKSSIRGSLAVLLADIQSKIFEVVSIDVQQDTSVGDVLSKARTCATDPALSEQKYVSFCYGTQEFGAPMLPIHLVIDWEKHKTRPLVVAVPVGSTAYEMQSVKRVLWKNPKLREWWKQDDPFVPKMKKEKPPIPPVVETTTTEVSTKVKVPPSSISSPKEESVTVEMVVESPVVVEPSVMSNPNQKSAAVEMVVESPVVVSVAKSPVPIVTNVKKETTVTRRPSHVDSLKVYERVEV